MGAVKKNAVVSLSTSWWQISEHAAHLVRLAQDVDRAQPDRSRVGLLSVASVRIKVDFPAPLGPSRPNIPGRTTRFTSCNAWTPFG